MLFFVEIVMLLLGLWIVIQGRVPGFILDRERAPLTAAEARLIGATLMLPLPLELVTSVMLVILLGGERGLEASVYVGPAVVVLVTVLFFALVFFLPRVSEARRLAEGHPPESVEPVVARLARQAYLFTLIGALGLTTPIFCPLAYRRAAVALRLIRQHGAGAGYRRFVRITRVAAVVVFAIYFLTLMWWAARLITQGF
ncbi:MAG: hypothetical protein Kow00124_30100 [Anaerolineae bacterium]